MKLAKIINLHGVSAVANLGDSYLCAQNRIYNKIRKATLNCGFHFSSEKDDAYAALPLSQLEKILSSKTIPYTDNISVLKQIENKMPEAIQWDDIRDNLKKNFLLHESCHAVARATSLNFKLENMFLNMLIEESFANTCELLGVIDAEDTAHRIFYEWNSYAALFEQRTNLKKAVADIPNMMTMIFYSYLHSNYLFNTFDEHQFAQVLKLGAAGPLAAEQLNQQQIKALRSLLKICFTLDDRFKTVTTRFHLRLNGIKAQYSPTSYFAEFEKNSNYREYVSSLLALVDIS